MNTKRGQGAAGAALVLAVVLGVIILFVLFITPEEREDLLDGETDDDDNGGTTTSSGGRNMLTAYPGRIDYLGQNEMDHPLPVVNIYTRTDSETIAERNTLYTKKGVFSEEMARFSFDLSEPELTENVFLAFSVQESQGRLLITLNGEAIFNQELGPAVPPVSLPDSLLQDGNELIFSVSSPGAAIWATNEVTLENVKIVADITTTEAQQARSVFLISETEKRNLESLRLEFQPECRYDEVGPLTVTVNGNEIYSAVPDCDLPMVPIEFSPTFVNLGENEIIFYTERGTYVLSHVSVESKLMEIDFPTYYFELSDEQYDDISDNDLDLRLKMDFVDLSEHKYGRIIFNGHVRHFDTKESSEEIDLSIDAVKGNNALKIKPERTIEVRQLKVDLID